MKTAILICAWQDTIVPEMIGDYIGIDRGASLLARQGIAMRIAIGDFDSIDEGEMENIRRYAQEIVALDAHKDISDTEAAVDRAISRGYDEIIVWGALGGRFDHALANLKLVERNACLRLMDEINEVFTLGIGEHVVAKNDKTYLSVFALNEAEISLFGFEYPLDHAKFTSNTTLGLSNALTKENARIIVHQGKLLIVRSKDK